MTPLWPCASAKRERRVDIEATFFSCPSEQAAHSLAEGTACLTRFMEMRAVQGPNKAQAWVPGTFGISELLGTRN